MPYLKINPGTFTVQRKQMFDYPTCQFCGAEHSKFQRLESGKKYQSERSAHLRGAVWKISCVKCRKTTAIVKDKID